MSAGARTLVMWPLVLGACLGAAVLKTWPLAPRFATDLPGGGSTYHMAWILAWGAHALGTDPRRLFEANLAYPVEHSFAFSEHMLGTQIFFAPVYALTGNPTAGHNAVFVLSFALSAFAAFCLSWYWTRRAWASLAAGMLFGFAPFRFGHLHHLHTLVFFWAPLALLFLDRFLRRRRWADLAAFAAFYWLQALSSIQLGLMTSVAVALYAAVWVAAGDRRALSRDTALKALAFAVASAVVLVPLHWAYARVRIAWGTPWTLGTLIGGSADLRDYLLAPPLLNGLYTALSRRIEPPASDDRFLFPGLVLPLLALLGLSGRVRGMPARDQRRLRLLFGVLALAALVLSLGPYLLAGGRNLRVPLPYLLLWEIVPGWGSIRIPSRFALLAVLAASPLAALGVARIGEAIAGGRAAALAALGVLAAFAGELGLAPMPVERTPIADPPAAYRWLARARPGPVLELPITARDDMRYLYLSTLHWLPVLTPRGSFAPPSHDALLQALEALPAPRAVEFAGAVGVEAIVLDRGRLSAEDVDRWLERERSSSSVRRIADVPPHLVYAVSHPTPAPAVSGALLPVARLPQDRTVRLGLVLAPRGGRIWVHPRPHGNSHARVWWTTSDTARVLSERVPLALPLVVGEGTVVGVRARTPDRPGRYRLRVTIPERGVDTGSIEVEVGAAPPASADGAPLAARYTSPVAGEVLQARPLGYLSVRLSVENAGDAVWLAKAPDRRGVAALRWRWLRDGREAGPAGRPLRVAADVFPGQAYPFALEVPAPREPGRYTLELGLASEEPTGFAAVGGAPLGLRVEVRP